MPSESERIIIELAELKNGDGSWRFPTLRVDCSGVYHGDNRHFPCYDGRLQRMTEKGMRPFQGIHDTCQGRGWLPVMDVGVLDKAMGWHTCIKITGGLWAVSYSGKPGDINLTEDFDLAHYRAAAVSGE